MTLYRLSKLDCAILVETPKEVRMSRVKMRSAQKFADRILDNGDLAENAWFSLVSSRSENFVTEWLEVLKCPVIRIDGSLPVEENVNYILSVLREEYNKYTNLFTNVIY